jgi:aspartate kinase
MVNQLEIHYRKFVESLFSSIQIPEEINKNQDQFFNEIKNKLGDPFTSKSENWILSRGELWSTRIFQGYLAEIGTSSVLLPALNFMRIDKMNDPDEYFIKSMLSKEIEILGDQNIYITQGYICRNAFGEIDNLQRGGSDFTATLIGAAIGAKEIQIWTDIDGLHNNDPREVDKTFPIRQLSYEEAAELAYFGAKILHPSCVLPAQKACIPIWLKNTMDPESQGTLIGVSSEQKDITAIAAKDGITAIKIKSGRMMMAYGFLKRVFEIFEKYQTPIDMITTSEVAVSLTIDNPKHLGKIAGELRNFGQVEIDENQTIICIVGNFISEKSGYANKIFASLTEIPIRMISYGGSKHNVSVLVSTSSKQKALQALNKGLFNFSTSPSK